MLIIVILYEYKLIVLYFFFGDLILIGLMKTEINSMDHHPYAIAIASIFGALDTCLSRDEIQSKINAIPFCKFPDIVSINRSIS